MQQWSKVKIVLLRCYALRRFYMTDSQNARGLSVHSTHSLWKSKQMLATYMQRMRNNNLEIRIAGDKRSPQ